MNNAFGINDGSNGNLTSNKRLNHWFSEETHNMFPKSKRNSIVNKKNRIMSPLLK